MDATGTAMRRRIAAIGTAIGVLAASAVTIVAMTGAEADTADDGVLVPARADGPIGYAAENGGTTGGFGAEDVTEATPASAEEMNELIDAHADADEDTGLVMYIDKTMSASNCSCDEIGLVDVSNVSIIGVGTSGELDGLGLNVSRVHNLVIQNLTIHNVSEGQGDGIGIQGESSNIWIDHNEIYNEYPDVDKDHYDGLIDIKNDSQYITVSWNHMHDSWKTMLTASNDDEESAGDHITYANNMFENVNSRVPLIRRSEVHFLNNYLLDVTETAVNARMGAQVLVEGNYFENVGDGEEDETTGQIHGPVGWFYGSEEPGFWNLVDNAYAGTTLYEHLESTGDFTVPYGYTALSPEEARDAVSRNAGVGVVG